MQVAPLEKTSLVVANFAHKTKYLSLDRATGDWNKLNSKCMLKLRERSKGELIYSQSHMNLLRKE